MASDNGHWTAPDHLTIDPDNHFGFVYEMINKDTGRRYIGKKQYKAKKRGKRSAKDMNAASWNPDGWKESNWKTYKSSSKKVMEAVKKHEFDFIILSQWKSSNALRFVECRLQWARRVLESDDYYNGHIDGVRFQCPKEIKTNEPHD